MTPVVSKLIRIFDLHIYKPSDKLEIHKNYDFRNFLDESVKKLLLCLNKHSPLNSLTSFGEINFEESLEENISPLTLHHERLGSITFDLMVIFSV